MVAHVRVVLLALAAAPCALGEYVATFEPPVEVGHSVGKAINASCGFGRFWFPASGVAIDANTLALEVSLHADGNQCPDADQPKVIVSASFDGGRSWEPQWFVGLADAPPWQGLKPGPPFCGNAGVPIAGVGLLCVGHNVSLPSIGADGTGSVSVNATLWTVGDRRLVPIQKKPIVVRCPVGAKTLPATWFNQPVRARDGAPLFRVAECISPDRKQQSQVIMRSDDGGWTWDTASVIPPWGDAFTHGKYPRGSEIAVGVVDDTSLLVINRVTSSNVGAQHHYVNYTMALSSDLGKSWQRWGESRNVTTPMPGQWSVLPKIEQLPTGEIMLAGGRPGVMLWVGGRQNGTAWQPINVAARHNEGVVALNGSRPDWLFEEELARLTPATSLHQPKCCPHPNCVGNGAWCQSTAYNSLMRVGTRGDEFVVVYDRTANGWGGPPGHWGAVDRVFSMRFRLQRP